VRAPCRPARSGSAYLQPISPRVLLMAGSSDHVQHSSSAPRASHTAGQLLRSTIRANLAAYLSSGAHGQIVWYSAALADVAAATALPRADPVIRCLAHAVAWAASSWPPNALFRRQLCVHLTSRCCSRSQRSESVSASTCSTRSVSKISSLAWRCQRSSCAGRPRCQTAQWLNASWRGTRPVGAC